MLYFEARPDPVFTAILHAALEHTRDRIDDLPSEDWWPNLFPDLASCFTPAAARRTITKLLLASRARHVYRLSDYHWLLVYDCLHLFCEVHNDLVAEKRGRPQSVGQYQIGPIDFELILEYYFWDTDFLFDPDVISAMGPEGRQQMGISDEVFGVSQGLAPHTDELKLTRVDDPAWMGEEKAEVAPIGPHIPSYPPRSET